jgi:dienelactone hydrolase
VTSFNLNTSQAKGISQFDTVNRSTFGTVARLVRHLSEQRTSVPGVHEPSTVDSTTDFEMPNTLLSKQLSGRALKEVSLIEPEFQSQDLSALAPVAQALARGRTPGQEGPFAVKKVEMKLGGNDVDVYLPIGQGPFPLNVYSPGLSHGQRNATANGNHFASWGVVTIVPSLGGNVNPVNSGRIVERIVSDVAKRKNLQGTQVRPDAIAVSGHSFGGLTASLAADHPAVKALLALDPNDNLLQLNPGKQNGPRVTVPAAFIFGDGGPNEQGPGIYHALASPSKYAIRLKNMPHLNFVSTSEHPDKHGQKRALDFATAFLLSELGQVKGAQPFLAGGEEIEKAVRAGELSRF